MCLAKEVLRINEFDGLVERVVIDQNRAEYALLGFQILRSTRVLGATSAMTVPRVGGQFDSSATGDVSTFCPSGASLTTLSITVTVTERWSLIGTANSPSRLIGSAS